MAAHESWNTISPEFRLSVQLLAAGPRAYVGSLPLPRCRRARRGVGDRVASSSPSSRAGRASLSRCSPAMTQTRPSRDSRRSVLRRSPSASRLAFAVPRTRVTGWRYARASPTTTCPSTIERWAGSHSKEPTTPSRSDRSWVEIAPDFESHFDVLAGDDQHVAVRLDARGHGADDVGGGESELVIVAVGTRSRWRHGVLQTSRRRDEGAALARLRDLRAGGSPV